MNRNNMIQTLRRFKVTSGYKGYYYLLDAADIISGTESVHQSAVFECKDQKD